MSSISVKKKKKTLNKETISHDCLFDMGENTEEAELSGITWYKTGFSHNLSH